MIGGKGGRVRAYVIYRREQPQSGGAFGNWDKGVSRGTEKGRAGRWCIHTHSAYYTLFGQERVRLPFR